MSLSVVPSAVRQGRHSRMVTVAIAMAVISTAIVPLARCSLRYARIVVRKLRYLSSHVKADLYIAVTATVK
ncbi:MAG: hypothetical protein PHN78_02930 [Dehalococcoidales bacterium]|nr:hypothetical protein [Dehalococcoidales bacterium]